MISSRPFGSTTDRRRLSSAYMSTPPGRSAKRHGWVLWIDGAAIAASRQARSGLDGRSKAATDHGSATAGRVSMSVLLPSGPDPVADLGQVLAGPADVLPVLVPAVHHPLAHRGRLAG